jgi:hypothetical protein
MDFSCQVANVRVNSSYDDDGDTVETLCGDVLAAGRKLSGRSLAGTFIQDWTADAALSITDYVWTHDLEEMAFTYTPNVAGPTITGNVRLEVPSETYGGDVNSRITSDFEWQITTPVVRLPASGRRPRPRRRRSRARNRRPQWRTPAPATPASVSKD